MNKIFLKDIKADDIEIQLRSPNSNEVWGKHETEVFRSADSVTFKLQQFGDACAFHCESNEKVMKYVSYSSIKLLCFYRRLKL